MGILENKGLYFPLMFPSIKPMSFYFILNSHDAQWAPVRYYKKKNLNYMGISENKGLYFTCTIFNFQKKFLAKFLTLGAYLQIHEEKSQRFLHVRSKPSQSHDLQYLEPYFSSVK